MRLLFTRRSLPRRLASACLTALLAICSVYLLACIVAAGQFVLILWSY